MKSIHLVLGVCCLLAACEEKENTSPAALSSHGPSEALQTVLTATPKEDAKQIHTVRTTAQPGDEITLQGRIFGSDAPFVSGRAVFTLGDATILQACNERPGDNCETPWDACCNSKEEKRLALATVQVVGSDGRVLKEGIEGVGGLEKLGSVIVTGEVAENSTPDSLIVNATAIRVKP